MSDSESHANPLMSDLAGETDMRERLEQFVAELPRRIDAIENCLAAHDLATLAQLVHQLQGAAGSYGLENVSGQAAEVQSSLAAHGDMTEICREIRDLA